MARMRPPRAPSQHHYRTRTTHLKPARAPRQHPYPAARAGTSSPRPGCMTTLLEHLFFSFSFCFLFTVLGCNFYMFCLHLLYVNTVLKENVCNIILEEGWRMYDMLGSIGQLP